MNRRTLGIVFIYFAAVLIMLSILFLFEIIRFRFAYTTASAGFMLYIAGTLLMKEGRLTGYRIVMIIAALALIAFAVVKEVL
jgi:hypothetical protein